MTDKQSAIFSGAAFLRAAALLGAACGAAVLSGCGPARAPLEGSVTLDGAPVNEAAIVFVPLARGRTKTGALIVDGRYRLPAEDGLLPGAYRVEIVDNPPLDSAPHAAAGVSAVIAAAARRTLPARYAHDSPLSYDARASGASEAPAEANFALTMKP